VPPGIKLVRVSVGSGQRAGSGEGAGTVLEAFKPGTGPPEYAAVSYQQSNPAPEAEPSVGGGTGGLY
jgi:penicillin-binding protein 1A